MNILQGNVRVALRGRDSGFTLIELMIVVAIVGVLAAVAIPAYSDYVTRAKITEATALLSSKRAQMEQYFQDNRAYDTAAAACVESTRTDNFEYSCDVASTGSAAGKSYTITAAGVGSMIGFTYTIDQTNSRKSKIESPAKESWRVSEQPCWITSKGQACNTASASTGSGGS